MNALEDIGGEPLAGSGFEDEASEEGFTELAIPARHDASPSATITSE